MLFIIFKVQMISTQQIVQFHCLQIIRIYKQTIIRSHGFHGRSPIFFLQCGMSTVNTTLKLCLPIKRYAPGTLTILQMLEIVRTQKTFLLQ